MMSATIAIYNIDGVISAVNKMAEACLLTVAEPFLEVPDDFTGVGYYVDTDATPHELAEKTAIAFTADKTEIDADGIDEITLSDLPNCNATMAGNTVAITDGELKLKVDLAGEYKVKLSGIKYLDIVFEFTAV
jgi:hypothetical protein